jgi:hypothetical protein
MMYVDLEIMTEVAWQLGDIDEGVTRAESRWSIVDIAGEIIESGMITDESTDIDEIIADYLNDNGHHARTSETKTMLTTDKLRMVFKDKLEKTGSLDAAFTKAVWVAYKRGIADGKADLATSPFITD